jgi:hypothetical protein
MMLTPLEAAELMLYLRKVNRADLELKEKCSKTASFYRLDYQVGNGKRTYLRRTYTCPFFNHEELGCPLPPSVKPFGCLAFNSHHETEKASHHCFSEVELLKERERNHPEELEINERLKRELQLNWEKAPIPLALLDLWEKDLVLDCPELS